MGTESQKQSTFKKTLPNRDLISNGETYLHTTSKSLFRIIPSMKVKTLLIEFIISNKWKFEPKERRDVKIRHHTCFFPYDSYTWIKNFCKQFWIIFILYFASFTIKAFRSSMERETIVNIFVIKRETFDTICSIVCELGRLLGKSV